MIFLVDQQLPQSLCGFFSERGFEAVHVKHLALSNASDRVIWQEALTRDAVIVSKDEDFTLIPRIGGKPQVIWIRTGNCSNRQLMARLADVWMSLRTELETGAPLVEVRL